MHFLTCLYDYLPNNNLYINIEIILITFSTSIIFKESLKYFINLAFLLNFFS